MTRVTGSRRVWVTWSKCTSLLPSKFIEFLVRSKPTHHNTTPLINQKPKMPYQFFKVHHPLVILNFFKWPLARNTIQHETHTMRMTIVSRVDITQIIAMNNTISKTKLNYNSFIHKATYFMRDHQSHLVPCFNHPTYTYYRNILNHDQKQNKL